MSAVSMILVAIAVLSASGVCGLLFGPRSDAGQRATTVLMVIGSVLGLSGLAASFGSADVTPVTFAWGLLGDRFSVAIDPVSVPFLALVFVVPVLGSVYGLEYWRHCEQPHSGRRLGLFQGLLAASMALVVVAHDAVLFLIAWEVMALSAFFAATVVEDDPAVRRAGWVYLIATHVGTLCLIAMFALWRHATGSFALEPAGAVPPELANAMFVLAVVGFGAKAGLMPLHVWLPGAHAGAPSHVSAVMSGVMLKMGIYGVVRMTMLLPLAPGWWGAALLVTGAITAVGGIAFALAQHDLKRLLAYSSIENVGIVAMGLGLALLGRTMDRPDWILLGLAGALLHVWNHGLFKSLLFLGAGAILHATHTRDMDQLGGLARRMPRVTGLFVIGAVAICGLPPLNGFASEWMIYVGLFRTLGIGVESPAAPAAAAAGVLAMVGALAVACFVKLTGTVFLGSARDSRIGPVHDPSARMVVPMAALAAACVLLGLFPAIASAPLEDAVRTWAQWPAARTLAVASLAPLAWITIVGLLLVALIASIGTIGAVARRMPRVARSRPAGTWDCGYARPTGRMQYTGSSLARTLVIQLRFVLWPKTHPSSIHGCFPAATSFKSAVPDPVLDRILVPLFRSAGRVAPIARVFQQGQTQTYVLYVLAILILLLVWGPIGVEP